MTVVMVMIVKMNGNSTLPCSTKTSLVPRPIRRNVYRITIQHI